MTNEEAIRLLSQVNKILVNNNSWLENTHEPLNMAFDMAIKALEQEPCEDAITRILKRMWNCRGKHTTSIDKVKMEQIIRDELLSVKPQEPKAGHWIPVSERLPKESDGTVLITVNGQVRTGQYSEFNNTWYKGDLCGVGGNDPIAWMPLPKPYEKQESEDKA